MSNGTVAVFGATGMLGRVVVQRLLADGYAVRALVRDLARGQALFGEKVEYGVGDVTNDAQVRDALAGCSMVYISLQGRNDAEFEQVEHQGTARIARLSAKVDIKRIGYLSGAMVSTRSVHVPQQQAKFLAEQAIRESGVPFTIFKPTYFMDSLPLSIRGQQATVIGRSERRLRFVAAQDYAAMVSRALSLPAAANQDVFVYGPEAITMQQAMTAYCSLVAPGVAVRVTPFWMMSLIDRLFLGNTVRPVIQLARLADSLGETAEPTAISALLGAPSTTLTEWCATQSSAVSPGLVGAS